jgi:hypothetical protein
VEGKLYKSKLTEGELMSEESNKLHKKFAVECFNGTWDLLDRSDRTPEEDIKLIHMAHASRFHWGEIGSPINFARGDWQLSRVYAVLGIGETAFKYAESSLNICKENGIGDFDLAFAYEALARASSILGNSEQLEEYKSSAQEAGEAIIKDGDRDYFFSELKTI